VGKLKVAIDLEKGEAKVIVRIPLFALNRELLSIDDYGSTFLEKRENGYYEVRVLRKDGEDRVLGQRKLSEEDVKQILTDHFKAYFIWNVVVEEKEQEKLAEGGYFWGKLLKSK
jgi:hypothetical protein